MNNELDEKEIEGKIYEINGIPVMLDSDLAKLYSVQTKRINEAVKNNPYKFPERFSWVLNIHDELNLRSKFSTSSLKSNYGGRRHNIRVFTEQGVAMLTTIIKSKVAVETSIAIMDAFDNNLKVIRNNTFHDRYIIIDKKEVYHLGTSINNAGNGIFSINKLEDEFIIKCLINVVGDII